MLAYQHSGFSVDAGVTTAHPPAPLFLCAGTEFTIQGSGDGAGPGATCATEYEVFPLLCPKCGGQMRLIAFITEAMQIRKILDHIGADSEPPHIALARGPPLWEDCDVQISDGVQPEPDWDLAAQPAPDYEVDKRINW